MKGLNWRTNQDEVMFCGTSRNWKVPAVCNICPNLLYESLRSTYIFKDVQGIQRSGISSLERT